MRRIILRDSEDRARKNRQPVGIYRPAACLRLGRFFWDVFTDLLKRNPKTPPYIVSLLASIADRPRGEWFLASNEVLLWTSFGNRRKTLAELEIIKNQAIGAAESHDSALRMLSLLSFVLDDLGHLEPELGLKETLVDS